MLVSHDVFFNRLNPVIDRVTTCVISRMFPLPPRKDHVAFEHESRRKGKPMLEYATHRSWCWTRLLPPNIANGGCDIVTIASDGGVTKSGIVWSDRKRTAGFGASTGHPDPRADQRGSWRPVPRSCHTRNKPESRGHAQSQGDTSAR